MKKTALCNRGHVLSEKKQRQSRFLTKILLVMKLTVIILFGFTLQLSAKAVSQSITFSGKEVSLKKVFSVIKKQTGYVVFYDEGWIANANTINVSAKNEQLGTFLQQVLKDLPLDFTIEQKAIIITRKAKPAAAIPKLQPTESPLPPPPIDVTVVVQNTEGQPLEGASIRVKGTQRGITTDANGRAVLKAVGPNAVLVISFTGYSDMEFIVGNNKVITVKLAALSKNLDDIVVIGYATQSRKDLTGSVSSVNSTQLKDIPVNSAMQALEGRFWLV